MVIVSSSARTLRLLLAFALSAAAPVFAAEPGEVVSLSDAPPAYEPVIAPASREAQRAMSAFTLPPGTTVQLVAAEPLLANPVCFVFDHEGRIFVAETFRQSQGVEDNRSHMNWLEEDLSLQTVEDRRQMMETFLADELEKYTTHHDRIRRLEDTDGDGEYETSTIYVSGFNDLVDGTGAGLLPIGDRLYYTCIPDLYVLRDPDDDGQAETLQSLLSGFGVRTAFRGHDMHGLIRGPDGKLYFSLGDRGYNVTSHQGVTYKRPDTGAVFRCNLDGSEFEVFAYGLRNPQELAFDDFGCLFTVDNNSDSEDEARFTAIAEGGDTGWRMYYQYLPDRGPWNRERMWHPYRNDDLTAQVQPAFIIPPIANIADGPSGLVCYPGVGLADKYMNHFFLADFRGQSSNSGIRTFAAEPVGASYALIDSEKYIWSVLATDVDFGWDGSIYVSDWVNGWNGEGKGRIYRFERPADQRSGAADVAALMAGGFNDRPSDELRGLLAHPDRRVRFEAQWELASRGENASLADAAHADLLAERLHGLWGLGHILMESSDNAAVASTLLELSQDDNEEVRAQVARVLGWSDGENLADPAPIAARLVDSVGENSARVRYFAAISLGKIAPAAGAENAAFSALVELIRKNNDSDPMLRHAGSYALSLLGMSESFDVAERLASLVSDNSAAVRTAAVVALRRLAVPSLARFLTDADPRVATEAARAIHDENLTDAFPALAALPLEESTPDALARRIINANFRLDGADAAKRIATFAADESLPPHLRIEALAAIAQWEQPQPLDRVTNEYRPLPSRGTEAIAAAVRDVAETLLASKNSKILAAALPVVAQYDARSVSGRVRQIVQMPSMPANARVAAVQALAVLAPDEEFDRLLEKLVRGDVAPLRSAARRLLARRNPERAVEALREALASGTIEERQSAAATLGEMNHPAARKILNRWVDRLIEGKVPAEIQLDIMNAARPQGGDLAAKLDQYEAARPADDPLAQYQEALRGGDPERGSDIFWNNATASCQRCHRIGTEGSDVGPDLSDLALREPREYYLESIVAPNAKIAKGFETAIFLTTDGKVHSGIVKEETDETIEIVTPEAKRIVIKKEDVEERAPGVSGMPDDIAKKLSKSDIRDLVAYMAGLRQKPRTQESHE